jgi:hypothetical protein
MMKVPPAERDIEQLKPHLKLLFDEAASSRWQSAAVLNSTDTQFRDGIGQAITHLLIGSLAASHRVRPADRKEIKILADRERDATRLIAEACRLYGGEVPNHLETALLLSTHRELAMERNAAQIAKLRPGRPRYRAFARFVRLAALAYERATNKSAIVKVDNARAAGDRCSGPFGELLEAAFADAAAIYKRAGFRTGLDSPRDKDARLDYARKTMQTTHAKQPLG